MFRRDVVLKIGGYRTNVEKSVDYNLYLDLLVNGETFVGVKEPLVQIMFDGSTWGRSGFEDLQTKYGLMGLVRYHCLQKYDVDLFHRTLGIGLTYCFQVGSPTQAFLNIIISTRFSESQAWIV